MRNKCGGGLGAVGIVCGIELELLVAPRLLAAKLPATPGLLAAKLPAVPRLLAAKAAGIKLGE